MKHLILTVSLITATYSAQAVEQKYFSTRGECEQATSAVRDAGGRMFSVMYLNDMMYKEKIVSFKCGYDQVRPYALVETRNEYQDRKHREELERNAKREAYIELQRKTADLLIGK